MKKIDMLADTLKDQRSKKVVFVSHCLLNENTRYLGGAFRKGVVTEIIEKLIEEEVGIIQMKCPEQWAWGGVLKKLLWLSYSSEGTMLYSFKPVVLKLFMIYTKIVYKKLAREVFVMITDYLKSGYKVVGIIGVDGSPTCGVNTKLEMKKSFEYFARQKIATGRDEFNAGLYNECAVDGKGIFFEELQRRLDSKGIVLPIIAHSLIVEMKGEKTVIRHLQNDLKNQM
ncbi:2-thiouracil desulfurase family protein [Acetivibrio cellulolyticus]|uniref:2-thiouracil desulfurase family protein n=1 Tax=Acetivibrio cellulolyticus TaxID=35830 RepID=UPI0001E2F65D|nr:2-thiouracil desulfurase family protein [Acetivibrio cellulolyticus]